ncbi:hypothetical protein KNP414_05924 [Paenibacillus mucilaginosus KNP414]|uniref:Uncharacterized protein n=1 Tax=Paenibacillus mucilaginosus (strain KNP414) TaxID=1036673 RepID=F8FC47_PAEMK|nr:hypothetical protein KNP414_03878 [Paenibacillus mucilaginosus KNP414]AEI44448.1 hypothetical protein KNP414_05924 [Paenibacillus mucilaginosus KNP414]
MLCIHNQKFNLFRFKQVDDWLPKTPVLSMATWVQRCSLIQSISSRRKTVWVRNVLISFPSGVTMQAVMDFL